MPPSQFILGETEGAPAAPLLTPEEIQRISLDVIAEMSRHYVTRGELRVTAENVYQPAVTAGRAILEAFQQRLFLAGSGVDGLDRLERCLSDMERGRRVLFLSEHRGNLDAPSLNALLRSAGDRYVPLLDKLVYVAGRKLSESSDFINMFAEKYSRIVIVPRREYPPLEENETDAERTAREAFEAEARRINWAAFRAMEKLKRQGYVMVLFPTGGRIKPGEHNRPVKETTSYMRSFDTAYLIAMEGNTLPPLDVMEDERPVQAKVLFRVGEPLECKAFLAERKRAFEKAGPTPEAEDFDQFVANGIIAMLAKLRETGAYGS